MPKHAPTLFGDSTATEFDAQLTAAYVQAGRTLDDLPYTPEFDAIFSAVGGDLAGRSRGEVLHRLQNLRKANRLPRLGRAQTPSVKVTPEEESTLSALVQGALESRTGSPALGQRDQLLYDDRFTAIVTTFNARTGRSLSPHDVWRLVAKLAK
ncbi:MAG: hypothetical protein U0637_12390 [Phycisphaerales bacterium]